MLFEASRLASDDIRLGGCIGEFLAAFYSSVRFSMVTAFESCCACSSRTYHTVAGGSSARDLAWDALSLRHRLYKSEIARVLRKCQSIFWRICSLFSYLDIFPRLSLRELHILVQDHERCRA